MVREIEMVRKTVQCLLGKGRQKWGKLERWKGRREVKLKRSKVYRQGEGMDKCVVVEN